MKHVVYLLIIISFLRKLASRILNPASRIVLPPGSPRDYLRRNSSGPWQVAVAPPGHRPIKVANCRDLDTANGLVDAIDSICTHNGYSPFAFRPKPELTKEERMILDTYPIVLHGMPDNSPESNRMYEIVSKACDKFYDIHGYR